MHWVLHCGGYKENWGLVWKHTVGQGELNLAKSHLRHSLSKGFGVKTTHGKLRVVLGSTGWFIAKYLEFELMFMHLWKIKDWGPGGDWKAKLYHETWVQRSLHNTLDNHKVAPWPTWKYKERHCIWNKSPFFTSLLAASPLLSLSISLHYDVLPTFPVLLATPSVQLHCLSPFRFNLKTNIYCTEAFKPLDVLHLAGEEARTMAGILPRADIPTPVSSEVPVEMSLVIRDRGITRQGQLIVFDSIP